ncbi:TrmH family RNA methyltransferase [soil metagenome]
MTKHTPKFDALLGGQEDTRNVIDEYKHWHVSAIKEDLFKKAFPLHIAIENYQHDYNIGSIVRTANACNVSGVHIVGKRQWNRRGAMATEKYLTVYHHKDIEQFQVWCENTHLNIVGVDNIPGSVPLAKTRISTDVMLVFGQEGPGLTLEMQELCSSIVSIEQFGSTRSVNVGVAAGIVMYDWIRQNVL